MRKDRCLFPGCKEDESSRGNCGTHYWVCYDIVNGVNKERTWEDLERAGLAKPKRRSARLYILEKSAPRPAREKVLPAFEVSDRERRIIEQLRTA